MSLSKISVFVFMLVLHAKMFAQAPEIAWEHLYCDGAYVWPKVVLMPDGDVVMATSAYSLITCEKDEVGIGGLDYWIIRIDAEGNIVWQKVIGGTGDDKISSINKTSDGGFIIAGTSNSPISGDKTEPRQDLSPPFSDDMWLMKLDSLGNIVWQNTIGGNSQEYEPYIEQAGSGFIVSCSSYSPISGDKMEGVVGGTADFDYWILKLNASGGIVWQNTVGGSGGDRAATVHKTTDGGYICTGVSNSNASGDKTQSTIGPYGSSDYWIVKLNSSGVIDWQKTIGTVHYDEGIDLIVETDGSYTIGGTSYNDLGSANYQLVRINSTGTVIWSNNVDSEGGDSFLASLNKSIDGGYLLGGRSNAMIGGDKTSPSKPMNSYGWEGWDMWLVKTNNVGNVDWDLSLGSGDDDGAGAILERSEGNYVVVGNAGTDEEGDITDKSILADGAWLVFLTPDTCTPSPELCNSLDDDCDGIIDEGIVESITVAAGGALTFCQGESVELLATTYTSPALQWKKNGEDIPGATSTSYIATQPGIYTCQTSSACAFAISEWLTVTVNKNPKATVSAEGPTTFCAGGSVVLTEVAVAGCTYQWYKGATPIAGATSLTYTATTSGNYKCRVTKAATGCYKNSNAIAVSVTCREENNIIENTFSLYPNPANNFITIETDFSTEKTIYITDALGQIVKTITTSENNITIDLNGIASGVYFIKMEDGINSVTKKFIKQ